MPRAHVPAAVVPIDGPAEAATFPESIDRGSHLLLRAPADLARASKADGSSLLAALGAPAAVSAAPERLGAAMVDREALGIAPQVYHLNEGHACFLLL